MKTTSDEQDSGRMIHNYSVKKGNSRGGKKKRFDRLGYNKLCERIVDPT